MPRLKIETFGTGDMSWLGSSHGINECRTELLDVSTFTVVNGCIPSGTPVAKVGGVLVPYDDTAGTTTGAGVLAGFILTDQKVTVAATDSDFAVPVLDHGRVVVSKLPVTIANQTIAAKSAAVQFVWI